MQIESQSMIADALGLYGVSVGFSDQEDVQCPINKTHKGIVDQSIDRFTCECGTFTPYGLIQAKEQLKSEYDGCIQFMRRVRGETDMIKIRAAFQTQSISDAEPHNKELPFGYKYSPKRGVFTKRGHEFVSPSIIKLTGRIKTTSGKRFYIVSFTTPDGEDINLLMSQSEISHVGGIFAGCDYGLPVTETNKRQLIRYFEKYINQFSNRIKSEKMFENLGWDKNHKEFTLPQLRKQMKNITVPKSHKGIKEISETFCKKGNEKKWFEMAEKVWKSSVKSRFMLMASAAGPLLPILNVDSFFIYLRGGNNYSSSSGKTTTLHFCASIWGDPEMIVKPMSSTPHGVCLWAGLIRHTLLVLDERETAKSDDNIQTMVYSVTTGKSNLRGHSEDGLRDMDQWRIVAIASGEQQYKYRKSGESARVISIRANDLFMRMPKDTTANKFAIQINDIAHFHYGHLAPRIIKQIYALRNSDPEGLLDPDKMRMRIQERYQKKSGDNRILARLGSYFAAVHISGYIMVKILNSMGHEVTEDSVDEACETIFTEISSEVQRRGNIGIQAYDITCNWINRHEERFLDRVSGERYGRMEIDEKWVLIIPSAWQELMANEKYEWSMVLDSWIALGLIDHNSGSRWKKLRVDKKTNQYLRLNISVDL